MKISEAQDIVDYIDSIPDYYRETAPRRVAWSTASERVADRNS
jgi:hypothetical protein